MPTQLHEPLTQLSGLFEHVVHCEPAQQITVPQLAHAPPLVPQKLLDVPVLQVPCSRASAGDAGEISRAVFLVLAGWLRSGLAWAAQALRPARGLKSKTTSEHSAREERRSQSGRHSMSILSARRDGQIAT